MVVSGVGTVGTVASVTGFVVVVVEARLPAEVPFDAATGDVVL